VTGTFFYGMKFDPKDPNSPDIAQRRFLGRRTNWGSMIEQPRSPRSEDRVQRPKPMTDFYGEDRHELVQELAYQHWEKRGSPIGSPEIDWFAAEKAMRAYLLASGIGLGPDEVSTLEWRSFEH
jgi:hypothetical protein